MAELVRAAICGVCGADICKHAHPLYDEVEALRARNRELEDTLKIYAPVWEAFHKMVPLLEKAVAAAKREEPHG